MSKTTLFDTLIVVKRSGQRTAFQGEKIALAIQKAFRSVDIPYHDEDVNKVYEKVLQQIEKDYQDRKTINIENIQDIIEMVLQKEKFMDVYQSFSAYRKRRNISRKTFVGKQQHKFLKAIEALGLYQPKEQDTPSSLLSKFGSTISYEFAKAYLLDSKTVKSHDSGTIFLYSIETIPMGSIESISIDLRELETLDTPFSLALRSQTQVTGYFELIKKLLLSLQNEVYGSIMFSSFDLALESIALKQYKEILKNYFALFFQANEFENFFSLEKLEKDLDHLTDFTFPKDLFASFVHENHFLLLSCQNIFAASLSQLKRMLSASLASLFSFSLEKEIAYNFGMASSFAGQLVLDSILSSLQDQEHIHYFFQVSKKINSSSHSPNYPYFKQFQEISYQARFCHCYYIFLDNRFNSLKEEVVSYFPYGARVIEDNTTLEKKLVGGKGNLATVSINLVRIALKHPLDLRGFYKELDGVIKSASDALLNRFEIECSKHIRQLPVLYGYGVWHDGEKLKDGDRLRKILKHGTLTIHFCGLKECLEALFQAEKKDQRLTYGIEIVQFMKKKITKLSDENNLNFSLSAVPYEFVEREFKQQDTAIFGKLKGITDQEKYSSGYFLPVKQESLAGFQKLANGGHLDTIYLDDFKSMEEAIDSIQKANFGCIEIKRKDC